MFERQINTLTYFCLNFELEHNAVYPLLKQLIILCYSKFVLYHTEIALGMIDFLIAYLNQMCFTNFFIFIKKREKIKKPENIWELMKQGDMV